MPYEIKKNANNVGMLHVCHRTHVTASFLHLLPPSLPNARARCPKLQPAKCTEGTRVNETEAVWRDAEQGDGVDWWELRLMSVERAVADANFESQRKGQRPMMRVKGIGKVTLLAQTSAIKNWREVAATWRHCHGGQPG